MKKRYIIKYEWGKGLIDGADDGHTLASTFALAIPIFGTVFWCICLLVALMNRKKVMVEEE